MAGKLYVDEIRDTATTGSPSFPNGLDITELTDPVGSEGEVLTVQADGSIAAVAPLGWPLAIAVADVEDAAVIGAAIVAALGLSGFTDATYHSTFQCYILSPDKDAYAMLDGSYETGAWVWSLVDSFYIESTGAGTVYLYRIDFGIDENGGGPA